MTKEDIEFELKDWMILDSKRHFIKNSFDFIIEPSAGAGSFLFNIPNENKIGIDIEPEHDLIKKQDFFT